MVFNCTSGRSAQAMLGAITDSMLSVNKSKHLQPLEDPLFDHVIFTTNVTYTEGGFSAGESHLWAGHKVHIGMT